MGEITRILERTERGDTHAADELLSAVYAELRRMASDKMAAEAPGHTLQPTMLVHEAWLRLGGNDQPGWKSRAHFFAAAGQAMRRILVDHARRRLAAKRGGGVKPLDLDAMEIASPVGDDETILRLHDALERFAEVDARKAELVTLRYFVGLTYAEAAEALGIAVPTAKQWWAYARAWLAAELGNPAE